MKSEYYCDWDFLEEDTKSDNLHTMMEKTFDELHDYLNGDMTYNLDFLLDILIEDIIKDNDMVFYKRININNEVLDYIKNNRDKLLNNYQANREYEYRREYDGYDGKALNTYEVGKYSRRGDFIVDSTGFTYNEAYNRVKYLNKRRKNNE